MAGRVHIVILCLALLTQGCFGTEQEGTDSSLRTTCAVPRLGAVPDPAHHTNAPGNPPLPRLTDAELVALASCVRPQLVDAFRLSESEAARQYGSWRLYSTQPFGSEHGSYLEIFANDRAEAFGHFEDAGVLPEGAVIAKHHFSVTGDGVVRRGPLLLMEKMRTGFSPATNNWRFIVVGPSGAVAGETGGRNAAAVEFCVECHKAARRQDFLMFVPPQYRHPG